jgi:AcrR family transcriptional regulator
VSVSDIGTGESGQLVDRSVARQRRSSERRLYGVRPALIRHWSCVYTVNMSTRARILACALAELERCGIDGFSLRSAGAAAGLSPMAVYRHFENKEDLLRALGEEAFATWAARVRAIRSSGFRAWFHQVARAYVEFAFDEPARFDVCFVLRTKVERRYPRDFRAGKSPVISLLAQRIADGQQAGKIRRGDPWEIAMFLWGQVHGLVMLHRSGRFAMPRKAFVVFCKRCTDLALDGIGVRA